MKKGTKKSFIQTDEIKTPLLDTLLSALKIILISGAITFLFKSLYYEIFPWVLSKNIVFPAWDITPWMMSWTRERDGIEIYVLYVLMFAISAVSALALNAFLKWKPSQLLNGIILIAPLVLSWFLFTDASFAPPGKIPSSDLSRPLYLYSDITRAIYSFLMGIFVLILLFIQNKLTNKKELLIVSIVSLPFLFIATTPVAISNYVYLFSPAQKMLNGVSISEIYFQYDFLISSIAALWMQAGIDLNLFQVLGQASNYVAILTVFYMAKTLFNSKGLALLLLISLILVKILSAPWDPSYVFQITALRLDLWLLPFVVIYFFGPLHWLTVLVIGMLILGQGSFGLIYLIGYIQLVTTLSFFTIKETGANAFFKEHSKSKKSYIYKTIFLVFCFILARILFGKSAEATSWYQKIGIGFLPLVSWSFFWLFPAVLGSASSLLLLMRKSLDRKYLIQATTLLYFTIGNCVYYFGRSDEMNLFSISIPLLFSLFMTLDLFDRWFKESLNRYWIGLKITPATISGLVFIICVTYTCFEKIAWNLLTKVNYATEMQFQGNSDPFASTQKETQLVLKELRRAIGPKTPIVFITTSEGDEFYFNQQEFTNSMFCYPFAACLFLPEVITEIQRKLDTGSYVLIDRLYAGTILPKLTGLGLTYRTKSGKYLLLGNKNFK